MFERIKRAMVESYVAAIALGWLLAQGIWHFANIFVVPITGWLTRSEYSEFTSRAPVHLYLRDSLPELGRSFFLLLFWYILLRWLYIKPMKNEVPDPVVRP